MRNTLKFLLCTMCCIMVFLPYYGYSMDYNNNNIQNNVSIYDDVNNIVDIATQYRNQRKQLNNNEAPNINVAYEQYTSLKQIISNNFINYVSNNVNNNTDIWDLDNDTYYINCIQNEYNKFVSSFNQMNIDTLANDLLNDNLNFIKKYSPTNTQVNCLFLAAWNILFQYAKDKGTNFLSEKIDSLMPNLEGQINIHLNNSFFIKKTVDIRHNQNVIQPVNNTNPNKNFIPHPFKNINQNIIQPVNINQNNNIIQINTKYNNPRVGLSNIGSTCYMNAVLQALTNNKYITDNILCLYKNNQINKTKQPLIVEYANVINNICCNKNIKYFVPRSFHNILGQLDPQFKNLKANAAYELLLFLIERFHEEMNIGNKYYKTNLYNNQYNKNIALQYFYDDYFNKNKSIFINQYYGINDNVMNYECKCDKHPILYYTFGSFDVIDFGLLDVSYNKRNKNPKYDPITIEDCFKYYAKTDKFEQTKNMDNRVQCPKCGQLCNATSKMQIYSAPKTIIIILNRGDGNKDYFGTFNFDEDLDITKDVDNQSNSKYYLSGTINHIGTSGQGGHFIACCRNGPKEQWYRYSDKDVKQPTFDNIKKDGKPFILFYTKYE